MIRFISRVVFLGAWVATALPVSAAVTIRVATWNILTFDGASPQFEAARDVLLRIGADVVCVQEIGSNVAFVNLANAAGYTCVTCRYLAASAGDIDTNADWAGIFCKYPYTTAGTLTSATLSGDPMALDIVRNFVTFTVQIPGASARLTIAGNHWKASTGDDNEFRRSVESIRAAQTVATLNSLITPFFIAGDMNDDINDPPDTPASFTSAPSGLPVSFHLGNDISFPVNNSVFAPLQNLTGTHDVIVINPLQVSGSDATYPSSGRRLDYIWRSNATTFVGAEVYNSANEGLGGGLPKYGAALPAGASAAASDHLPVFVDLRMASTDAPADFDGDLHVNLRDYAALQSCLTGPLAPLAAGCAPADLFTDNHVDLYDAAQFATLFTGP